MDFLEYFDMGFEQMGAMANGRLKFTDTHVVFKNSKTGKVEQVAASDIEVANWQRFAGCWGIRIFSTNGNLYRFTGFKEADKEKLAKFFSNRYNNPMLEKELCLRGWNWGTASFNGNVLDFEVDGKLDFEVPLSYVSQCTTGKNEVTLEFHQNDDAPVSLMELRFHIPSSELAGDDTVDSFKDQVLRKASIISATGDAIAIFREIPCVSPRGRYDIKMFSSFFQLHGKTFDYKIPLSTVLRLFLLPHKDGRQTYFVVSLDPPIKQGQTRYHYVTFLFNNDEEDITVDLPLSDDEIKSKYEGKLTKEMSGPAYEIVSKLMKAMVNRKLTGPGSFVGHSSSSAVTCSYKAAAGYLYPLDRGFIFLHKPPLHVRFEEVSSVNFARGGGSTRSFDFEVETKAGVVHTFSSIEKDEFQKLYDYVTNKNLRIKNRSKMDKPGYQGDFDNSDVEDGEPDAYLARVKAEAQERDEDDFSDEGSEEDEDFNPDAAGDKSDVAEEFDSNASSSDSDEEGSGSGSDSGKKKKKDKPKKAKTVREPGTRKKRGEKKKKDKDAPKRPQSAYFLWMNANRESLKKKYPSYSVADLSKKAGELWRELKDKSEWEEKAKEAKEEYEKAKKNYVPKSRGSDSDDGGKKKKKSSGSSAKTTSSKSKAANVSPTKAGSGTNFKSKEFIESDDDSSSGDDSKSESGSD